MPNFYVKLWWIKMQIKITWADNQYGHVKLEKYYDSDEKIKYSLETIF